MSRSLMASMRRMQRLMRPATMTKATRSALIGAVFAPAKHSVALFRQKSAKPARARRGLPEGSEDQARVHRTKFGSRAYRLYLPASAARKPAGLILMLHGCGQDAEDFAIGTHMDALAEKHRLAIAYPQQARRHNSGCCWNWFDPAHQCRSAGEPAILAALTRKLTREFGLTRQNVFVAGLSAGGSMAAILADVYPDVFAAAGVHSGLARGSAQNVSSAMKAMRKGHAGGLAPARKTAAAPVRRIIFHGDNDDTVHVANSAALILAALGVAAKPHRITRHSRRGISYCRSEYAGVGTRGKLEMWLLHGAGHAWSGGRVAGSFTDARGPDASAQMVRFFLAESR